MGIVGVVLGLIAVLVAIAVPLLVEKKKRPRLLIERADDANSPLGFRIVHIKVINQPLTGRLARWLVPNEATSCRVDISFRSLSDGQVTNIAGRWSGTAEPFVIVPTPGGLVRTFDPSMVPETLRFSLAADAVGEALGIAIKQDGDTEAYAFTSASYAAPDTRRLVEYQLPDSAYEVIAIARTGQIETRRMFRLENQGPSHTGLDLVDLG